MPHKDEPDTASATPDPPEESSPSPEVACGGRDSSENRESSAEPTTQEREPSGDQLEDPNSASSDAVSVDSICSRCGGSKSNRDKGAQASSLTVKCKCGHELDESHREESKDLQEDASESAASDALSDDSICPRCGGWKRSKGTDLKPPQFFCECSLKKDEVQDIEDEPLQELPLVAVATQEISHIENFRIDQNPDLCGREPPADGEPAETEPNEDQRGENRSHSPLDLEACVPDCPDISCGNCHWKTMAVIVSAIAALSFLFIYFITRELLSKYARSSGNNDEYFEKDLNDQK